MTPLSGELTAVGGKKKETPIIGNNGTDPITECGFRGKTDEYVRDKRCLTSSPVVRVSGVPIGRKSANQLPR